MHSKCTIYTHIEKNRFISCCCFFEEKKNYAWFYLLLMFLFCPKQIWGGVASISLDNSSGKSLQKKVAKHQLFGLYFKFCAFYTGSKLVSKCGGFYKFSKLSKTILWSKINISVQWMQSHKGILHRGLLSKRSLLCYWYVN